MGPFESAEELGAWLAAQDQPDRRDFYIVSPETSHRPCMSLDSAVGLTALHLFKRGGILVLNIDR
jgi:hypothetical protein